MAALGALALSGIGCASRLGCGDDCRQKSPYAGMKYQCPCETCGPEFCQHCGAQDGACGDQVQCGSGCDGGKCDGRLCRRLWSAMFHCTGCGELYWNEWINDPPACVEPCDCYGNYIGPAAGYFRAPYRRDEMIAEGQPVDATPLEAVEFPPLGEEPPLVDEPPTIEEPPAEIEPFDQMD
jgi:hypothetical protein